MKSLLLTDEVRSTATCWASTSTTTSAPRCTGAPTTSRPSVSTIPLVLVPAAASSTSTLMFGISTPRQTPSSSTMVYTSSSIVVVVVVVCVELKDKVRREYKFDESSPVHHPNGAG